MDMILIQGSGEPLVSQFIDWLVQYSIEVNAVVSLLLTVGVLAVYIVQTRELKRQSSSMEDQTQTIRAGIEPVLQVDSVSAPEQHPVADIEFPNPDYIELKITNAGNEVAKNLQLTTLIAVEDDIDNLTVESTTNSLEPISRPIVEREGEGGILAAGDTKSFFAPVEVRVNHENISAGTDRLPNAVSSLDQLGVSNIGIQFVLSYSNLAESATHLPIEPGFLIDVDSDYSSFSTILDNQLGTCDLGIDPSSSEFTPSLNSN